MRASALTLLVLPWSVPMPMVRVALQVLDRAIALAVGQRQVGGGDVVLMVDEVRFSGRRRLVRGHQPHRARIDRCQRQAALGTACAPLARKPAARGGGQPASKPCSTAIGEREAAGAAAPAERCFCPDLVGNEGGDRLVEAQLAARLREQMHGRVPAAGMQDRSRIRDRAARR
mgnify:CR=1 FL=1